MIVSTQLHHGSPSLAQFVCDGAHEDTPVVEQHTVFSVSYVRKGSFGCRTQGAAFELVPGSVLIGCPGDEYMCTHEHSCGDECLSFRFSAELAASFSEDARPWRVGCLPPLPQIMVLGELAHSAAAAESDIGFDEIGLMIASRCIGAVRGARASPPRVSARDRRRSIEAATFIDAHSATPLDLEQLANLAALSPFHFLRVFAKVIGVTPHQYLIRARLRRAARLLVEEAATPITQVAYDAGFEDVSNFVRTFRRAANASPGEFRRASRGERKFLQEPLPAAD